MTNSDSLIELFTETRQARPPVYLADEWGHWLAAIGQVLAAFRRPEQRWAATLLIGYDVAAVRPDLDPPRAYGLIAMAVEEAARSGR